MKTSKLNLALIYILAFLAITISSFAQDKDTRVNKSPEERARISAERMKTSLNLSDEQYTKVYELNLQRAKDFESNKETKAKIREDRKKKGTEYKNSLKSILTDDQLRSMKNMHKEKKMKKHHKVKHHYRNKL